jgi:hypothetical protein
MPQLLKKKKRFSKLYFCWMIAELPELFVDAWPFVVPLLWNRFLWCCLVTGVHSNFDALPNVVL